MEPINKLLLEFLAEYKQTLVLGSAYRSALADIGIPFDAQSHRNSVAEREQSVNRYFADCEQRLSGETPLQSTLADILRLARSLRLE